MRKRILYVLLLVAALTALFAQSALAAPAKEVIINGFTLDANTRYYKNNGTIGSRVEYNAAFDAKTGTLTLLDLDIETWHNHGIEASGDLILDLQQSVYGDGNVIRVGCSNQVETAALCGIKADSLTIRGNSNLTITCKSGSPSDGRGNDYGIRATDFFMEEGIVHIPYSYSIGIYVTNMTVSGGNLSAQGGMYGVDVTKDLKVTGGRITATGYKAGLRSQNLTLSRGGVTVSSSNPDSTALYTYSCNVSGGTLNVTGTLRALHAVTGIYLSGGTVNVTSSRGTGLSCGQGVICLTGGTVNSTSADGAFNTMPAFSACNAYEVESGSSESDAVFTPLDQLQITSKYVYAAPTEWGHTPVTVPGVAPTCTEAGKTDATKCSVCGLYLTGPGHVQYLNHSYVQENTDAKFLKTAATCKAAAEYYYSCSCGAKRTYGSTFTYGDPLPHTPVTDAAVPPTCTESGLTEGSHCEVCGQTIVKQEEIPANGHTYEVSQFLWAEDLISADAALVCHCAYETEKACTLSWDTGAEGKLTVTATVQLDEQRTESQSLTVTVARDGDTVTVTLPHRIPNMKAFAATYDGNQQMTAVTVLQIDGNRVILSAGEGEVCLFLLNGSCRPICPMLRI